MLSKIDQQEKKIENLEERVQQLADPTPQLEQIVSGIESLKSGLNNNSKTDLRIASIAMQIEAVDNKIIDLGTIKMKHHHYVPKLFWVALGLFMGTGILASGWFTTYQKLDDFIMNDTKYRAIKLDTALKSLQRHLDQVDASYKSNPQMREQVLGKEEEYRRNFERRGRAERLRKEAEELEQEAKVK
jgi:uncharacterized phage infection (PIP) family protein YhgE